jgi:mitochondrial import receptor subunit TOM20
MTIKISCPHKSFESTKKCVPQICGVFTLTAFINHSCDPLAEVRGGEYTDSRIDIVAKRAIQKGQEISISYINLMGTDSINTSIARNRRRKQLESKYLFNCNCNRCIDILT